MLFLLFQLTAGILCPKYECYDFESQISDQCINQVGAFYQLSLCNDEYFSYCSPNYEDTFCDLPPTTPDINTAYPGEPCTYDRNCLNGICESGVCQGQPFNSLCDSDEECGVGLFCNFTNCA